MTSPLRPCGNPRCRLCRPAAPPRDRPWELVLGAVAIVVMFFLLAIVLPVAC